MFAVSKRETLLKVFPIFRDMAEQYNFFFKTNNDGIDNFMHFLDRMKNVFYKIQIGSRI